MAIAATQADRLDGLVEVSQGRFFEVVNPMDVNPLIVAASLKSDEHVSLWETRRREVVGRSLHDARHGVRRYWLASMWAA